MNAGTASSAMLQVLLDAFFGFPFWDLGEVGIVPEFDGWTSAARLRANMVMPDGRWQTE